MVVEPSRTTFLIASDNPSAQRAKHTETSELYEKRKESVIARRLGYELFLQLSAFYVYKPAGLTN
jgi:hypothetical protein